jgi:dienelactone hydrolase
MLLRRLLRLFLIVLLVATSTTICGASDSTIGVVLLHGKGGMPKAPYISSLARDLEREGIIVITPEMPYSRYREYDKSYEDTVSEIDKQVSELKSLGARTIFVAGHSLGANVALYYATVRSIDGVIAMAPAQTPELRGFQDKLGNSVERARRMVNEGNGDRQDTFADFNLGKTSTIKVSAKIYLSWFDPDGPAIMPKNAAAMKPGTALLWVVGTRDRLVYERGQSYAFDKAPSNPNNKYLVVESDHLNTPRDASAEIIKWLKAFKMQ